MTDIGIKAMQCGFSQQGYYTTAEKRNKDAKESKGTHFSLGNHPRIGYS